jgi:tRNA U34 5-methylaminomethyl-2-thiouridine-forming methyltransferase MnmC
MADRHEIIVSGDGSHTIISPIFKTAYHSHHGALTESEVVFIQAGLEYLKSHDFKKISVFEMGFGTGLNAILAWIWAEKEQIPVTYHTVEAYPVPTELITQLNYVDKIGYQDSYMQLHTCTWAQEHKLSDFFTFCKHQSTIESLVLDQQFDVIFFDAFAPSSQPHLWEQDNIQKMYDLLKYNGVLTSFCAQGAFKRYLKAVGFTVESLAGPPGKREMTRALKL